MSKRGKEICNGMDDSRKYAKDYGTDYAVAETISGDIVTAAYSEVIKYVNMGIAVLLYHVCPDGMAYDFTDSLDFVS
jgi:hypothetical protein